MPYNSYNFGYVQKSQIPNDIRQNMLKDNAMFHTVGVIGDTPAALFDRCKAACFPRGNATWEPCRIRYSNLAGWSRSPHDKQIRCTTPLHRANKGSDTMYPRGMEIIASESQRLKMKPYCHIKIHNAIHHQVQLQREVRSQHLMQYTAQCLSTLHNPEWQFDSKTGQMLPNGRIWLHLYTL